MVGMMVCECVIVCYVIVLIEWFDVIGEDDIVVFEVEGLMYEEIFDLLYVIVIFVWVNWLMLMFGELVFLVLVVMV